MTNTEKTKIIATIGPACENEDILEKMILSGVDFLRLNFSHNTHSWHAKTIEKIRKIEKRVNKLVPIIADIQGPKIRIGTMPEQGLEIKNGQKIFIDCRASECNNNLIPLPSKLIEEGTKKDDLLYLDDGTIHIQIEKKDKNILRAIVLKGGILFSKKGVNAPNLRATSSILNLKDISDIKFAIENKVDYVAISFLRNAKDVQEARKILGKTNIKIISKIERHEALVNIKEITDASDIIMVARGDLGIETPLWELPIRQKEIIDLVKGEQKPVVVATQMLDSMIRNPLPTRAEVSDVANAVFESADAVMLSGETAIGKYPLEAVSMMKKIIDATYQKRDLICKMKSRICK